MKVLGIEFEDIVELIRFNINVKQERVGLFSYKKDDMFHIGFYYPSFLKNHPISFLYVSLKSHPPHLYSYNPESRDENYLIEKPELNRMGINIPVAFIEDYPHGFVDPVEIKDSWEFIRVSDLKSLVALAESAYFESSDIPYIWYDISRRIYLLGVHSSSDSENINLFFYFPGEYMGPYISISNEFGEITAVKFVKDVSRNYFLIVRVKELPYLSLKNK